MTEEVKQYLQTLIQSINSGCVGLFFCCVDGLHAIVISDRDGVPVVKMDDQKTSEEALRPAFLVNFSHMTEQASRIGLGSNKCIIAFYENVQIVQMNKHPLLLTFIADPDCITGEITNLELDLQDLLDEIKEVTEAAQQ